MYLCHLQIQSQLLIKHFKIIYSESHIQKHICTEQTQDIKLKMKHEILLTPTTNICIYTDNVSVANMRKASTIINRK